MGELQGRRVAATAGIGFTVPLVVVGLAYPAALELAAAAKVAVRAPRP